MRTAWVFLTSIMALAAGVWAPATAQTPTTLSILWEVNAGSPDYMTTTNPFERDLFPVRGAVAYVPFTNIVGTQALYRLYNGTDDHMDSLFTSEGPYSAELVLGYPWQSSTAVPGLSGLTRLIATVDHATVYSGDTIPGYSLDGNYNVHGYARFNNTASSTTSLSAGGVTIASNSVIGGALSSWIWNGIEFIDNYDYGRQMQASLFFRPGNTGTVYRNPNEAGSRYSASSNQPYARQGSPRLNNQNAGNTQITRAIPLEWDPSLWGGDEWHPVIYSDMQLGKNITLDYNGMGAVAQYMTVLVAASVLPETVVEIPTAYMPPTFNRFYTYDAASQTLTEVTPPISCVPNAGLKYIPSSGYGGVIISNSAQTAAMGVYGRTSVVNLDFGLFDFRSCDGGQTTKWNANVFDNLGTGTTTWTTYVTTGTLTNVVANMRQLYVDGAP